MRKIMFDDKYGLETAVIELLKTMTRRKHRQRSYEAFCEVTIWKNNQILLRIEKTLDGGCGVNKVHNCTIQHLHELQHAMRLCGIKKELTL